MSHLKLVEPINYTNIEVDPNNLTEADLLQIAELEPWNDPQIQEKMSKYYEEYFASQDVLPKMFQELQEELSKRNVDLNRKLSYWDKAEQDMLHYIEFEKCDAIAGAKLIKQLKYNRQERRKVKRQIAHYDSILQKLKVDVSINTRMPTYKTDVISFIFGNRDE